MTTEVNRWTLQHTGGPRYLHIEVQARVLVLEDSDERCERFLSWLSDCVICRTVSEAVAAFDRERFDWLFIDRDLGGPEAGYGEEFCKHIAQMTYGGRVVIHSANIVAARYMEQLLKAAKVKAEIIPFTVLGVFCG
jgi:hypothetical protein